MWWKAPDQEVDQKGRGERLCKKIVGTTVDYWALMLTNGAQ